MPSRTPIVNYEDSYTVGQLARMRDKPADFVRRMVYEGKLQLSERGLVTNAALRDFSAAHGTALA